MNQPCSCLSIGADDPRRADGETSPPARYWMVSQSGGLMFDSCPGSVFTRAGVAGFFFAEGVFRFRKSGLLVNVRFGRKMLLKQRRLSPARVCVCMCVWKWCDTIQHCLLDRFGFIHDSTDFASPAPSFSSFLNVRVERFH